MLIDRTHRNWVAATVLSLALSAAAYVLYARAWPGGPSGRTWPGMLFGVAATLLMVFAALLAVRKKTIRLRMGSLSWWLKGHLWLSLLSIPMVFFHAAFRWGGTIEIVLWLTLAVVAISGVVGVVLQNLLPRTMKMQLPFEIIPDQLAEVCGRLTMHADKTVISHCGAAALLSASNRAGKSIPAPEADPKAWLASFYIDSVRPFLGGAPPAGSPFANLEQAQLTFEQARSWLPHESHSVVDSLEELCATRLQLEQQIRLHRWLHSWLKVHVPGSIVLLVFIVVHVLASLYY